MKFGFDWPSGLGGEDLEIVNGGRRRTPEHGYYYCQFVSTLNNQTCKNFGHDFIFIYLQDGM